MSSRNFGIVRAFALLLHTVPDAVPIAGNSYCFLHDLSPGASEIKQFAVDPPNRIVVLCRESFRKLSIEESNFGGVLRIMLSAPNPQA
jgi:hypothetical protein